MERSVLEWPRGGVFVERKFVPLGKQSKREKKKYHAARRKDWGGLNPVTRRPSKPKAYDRKKSGRRYESEPPPGVFFEIIFIFPLDIVFG